MWLGNGMRQMTLASQASFEKYARKSRREEFLNVMAVVVPWDELEALIERFCPKAGNGRQPVGLSIMLRVYFLQQWFNLSDPGAEDALYESPVLRRFAGVDLGRAAAPDETTILRFRRILEQHDLYPGTLRQDSGHGEPLPGKQRPAHIYRGHHRCHDHRGSFVDQERQERARSGDASDAQREPVVFRRQGAHRRGFQVGRCALGVHFSGLGLGRAYAARSAARR